MKEKRATPQGQHPNSHPLENIRVSGGTVPRGRPIRVSLGDIAWPALVLALVLGSVGLTSLSFCLAWLVTSTHAYHALMSVLLLPLWMVSGAMFPAPPSGVVRFIMDLNPMTYCVEALRHALHGGTAEVASMTPAFAMLALTGFAIGMTCIAIWLTTRVQRWRP